MALEHPKVREAVAELADQGIPSVTLVSDLSHSRRSAYVGLDNRAAGRTAALLIGRFLGPARRGAKVAMLAGSLSYRAHEEREEIGRASCRERVCQYVEISVVAVSLNKKTSFNY